MKEEYELMSSGHASPRHAYAVDAGGEEAWVESTADPALGTPGGHSHAAGFGPYTLGPGESVRIVLAEAANGLSRSENERVGRLYQQGLITDGVKNEAVFQSRDSLLMVFRRAIANNSSGWDLPRPPHPPSRFAVKGESESISLSWEIIPGGPAIDHFEIYRSTGRYDSTYTLLHVADATVRSFDDTAVSSAIDYYYYIQTVGRPEDNDGAAGTPPGLSLRSSRYYTQTYDAVRLQVGLAADDAGMGSGVLRENYPNPFSKNTTISYSISRPSAVRLVVTDVLGREVRRLVDQKQQAGTHRISFDGSTLPAGLYLYRLEAGRFVETRRMVVVH
jgi:hypothetical protein